MTREPADTPSSIPAPHTARPGPCRDWGLLLGLALLVLAGGVLLTRHALATAIPFADTLTYLDPGRNLLEGRGFVTRFNVVYGWSGALEHPGLGHYNPVFGLAIAAVWHVARRPDVLAFVATVLPALLNIVLLAVCVYRAAGRLPALLSAAGYLLLPTTYHNVSLIGAEHVLVTICLALLLIVQGNGAPGRRRWLVAGVVFGVGCLVKVTLLVAAPALLAGLWLTTPGRLVERTRRMLAPAVLFLVGAALVLVPFNAWCRATTGAPYPEYPPLAKNWSLANLYGGKFVEGAPAVVPDAGNLPGRARCLEIVCENARTLLSVLAGDMGLLLLAVLLGIVAPRETRLPDALVYLLLLGGAFLGAYAAAYSWVLFKHEASSPARYALHTVAFWYPVGIVGLMHAAQRFVARVHLRNAAVVLAWLALASPAGVWLIQTQRGLSAREEPRVAGLMRTMEACRKLSPRPDDLVAVSGGGLLMCGAMFLDRPVVSLPQGQMDNETNTRQFLRVFNPKLIVPAAGHSIAGVLAPDRYDTALVPGPQPGDAPLIAYIRNDDRVVDDAFAAQITPWEQAWAHRQDAFAITPQGDAVATAHRLLAKYQPLVAEFYESPPGLAVGKPVRSSPGVERDCVPQFAVNGHYQTPTPHWSAFPLPQWLEVDLEQPQRITQIHVFPFWDNERYYQYFVELSLDGETWELVVDATANLRPATRSGQLHAITPRTARYVRLTVTHNNVNAAAHIVELKVYGDAPPP